MFDRLVLFLEPAPTGERDALGAPVYRDPVGHRVWCSRQDRGGAEGFTAESVVGGDWQRRYECHAEAFPAGRRPTEQWSLEADDGVPMAIREVVEMESGPHPVRLAVLAYRSVSRRGGA